MNDLVIRQVLMVCRRSALFIASLLFILNSLEMASIESKNSPGLDLSKTLKVKIHLDWP